MSQVARHQKQAERLGREAAAMMRQRDALAPKPMAVYVRLALRWWYCQKKKEKTA